MDAELNVINYVNVATFLLSWLLNSQVADQGPGNENMISFLSGLGELARRYESIVTPLGATFLMSHLVLLLQGVFTVAQLLPQYRASSLVQDGVKYWFAASVIAQLLWSLDFALDNAFGAFLSVAFMALMVFFNGQIMMSQASLTTSNQTSEEFWLLRFPFNLHTGWTMAVFFMSINGFVKAFEPPQLIQLIVGLLSLAGFVAISWKMLLRNGDKPNYAIPAVLAWFVIGITFDNGPKGEMDDYFSTGFSIIAAIVGLGIAGFTGYLFYTNEVIFRRSTKDIEGNEQTAYVAPNDAAMA